MQLIKISHSRIFGNGPPPLVSSRSQRIMFSEGMPARRAKSTAPEPQRPRAPMTSTFGRVQLVFATMRRGNEQISLAEESKENKITKGNIATRTSFTQPLRSIGNQFVFVREWLDFTQLDP